MPGKPNDRPRRPAPSASADPRVYLVVDGEKFPRPGLETVFVEAPAGAAGEALAAGGCACKPVAIPVCACIKVSIGGAACACVGHAPSSPSSTGGGFVCRCAPVH